MFGFAEFYLKFDSSDGFLDHYVFSSGKQLFNLLVLILFLYLNAGNLNLFLRALHCNLGSNHLLNKEEMFEFMRWLIFDEMVLNDTCWLFIFMCAMSYSKDL